MMVNAADRTVNTRYTRPGDCGEISRTTCRVRKRRRTNYTSRGERVYSHFDRLNLAGRTTTPVRCIIFKHTRIIRAGASIYLSHTRVGTTAYF